MINKRPPRVLITGKNGQVGRELTERAAELAIDFVAFDSKELDIRDRSAVLAAVVRHQPTAVINPAAYTAVDKAEEEVGLAYAVNRDGVENLALACKAQDVPLIHISTDYVFDGEKNSPYVESDTPNPTGVYGASKYAGEEILRVTWHKHVIVRVSWVFGRYGNNFVKTMLRLAQERDELGVVDDQFGAPTSASSIASVLIDLAFRTDDVSVDIESGRLLHLESGPGVTWCGFARSIFSEARKLSVITKSVQVNPISSDQFPTPITRPKNSKLSSEVGLIPVQWWKEGLDSVLREIGR